jgi:hypothetical protein
MQFHLELENHNIFPEYWINLYNHTILMTNNNQNINFGNNEINCLKKILDENKIKYEDNIFENISYLEIGIFLLKSLMIKKNKIKKDNYNLKRKLKRLIKITPNNFRKQEFREDITNIERKNVVVEERYQAYYADLDRFIKHPYSDTYFTNLLNLNKRRLDLSESPVDENDIHNLL